jgi:hypothetical protein
VWLFPSLPRLVGFNMQNSHSHRQSSTPTTAKYSKAQHCCDRTILIMKFSLLITALVCTAASAFVPASQSRFGVSTRAALADEVDSIGNNVAVKNLLSMVEEKQLLTKVAESGLLSKAQQAGVSLSSLEPFLSLASQNPDILILVEASGPELLPLLPKIVDLAPGALPLLASAISIPAPLIGAAGLGALAAAGYAVVSIPDDSVTNIAIQTAAVGLALPLAAASLVGSSILGKLTR